MRVRLNFQTSLWSSQFNKSNHYFPVLLDQCSYAEHSQCQIVINNQYNIAAKMALIIFFLLTLNALNIVSWFVLMMEFEHLWFCRPLSIM